MADLIPSAPKRQKRSKQVVTNGDRNGHNSPSHISAICNCGKCTLSTFLQRGCPKPSIILLHTLPHIDLDDSSESRQLIRKGGLYLEYLEICDKFSSLEVAILKSLSDRRVPVESVAQMLQDVGAFQSPHEHTPLLLHHLTAIKETKTLNQLFTFVSNAISFFNHSLLEQIVDKLGTERDKAELGHYKSDLMEYSRRNLFECPSFHSNLHGSSQLVDVILKVDKTFSTLSVGQLSSFVDWLSSVLMVSRATIQLTSVTKKEDCHVEMVYPQLSKQVEVVCCVSSFVRDEVLPVSPEQEDILRTGGVLEICSGDLQQVMGGSHQVTPVTNPLPISEHPPSTSEYFNNLTMAQAALLLNPPPLEDRPTRNGHTPEALLRTHCYSDGFLPPNSSGSFGQSDLANQFLTSREAVETEEPNTREDQLSGEGAGSGVSDSDDGGDKPKPKPAPGKKTRGRVKIPMKYIKNKLRRYTTFSKRKSNIMKKAYELSTLTGTQVMLMVASETGHVYTFATPKLQPMITSEAGKALIQTCLHQPDPPPSLIPTTSSSEQFDVRMSSAGYEEVDLSAYKLNTEEQKSDKTPSLSSMSSLLPPPVSFSSDIASLMPVLSSLRPPPLSLASPVYSPMKPDGEKE